MKPQMFLSSLLGLSLPWVSAASSFPRNNAAPSPLVVHLTSGTFRGETAGAPNNTDKWLGIPFAQPPLGSLRFKAPVAITNPSPAVKNATQFGNACPQRPSDSLGAPLAEDCLFLNVRSILLNVVNLRLIPCQVWRPAGTSRDANLPVLVWFYVSV